MGSRPKVYVGTALLLVLAVVVAGANAAGGYGPLTPPTLPGGSAAFETSVKAAKTFSSAGGKLSVRLGRTTLEITVPAKTFSTPVQISVTAPSTAKGTALLHTLKHRSWKAALAAGVLLDSANGTPYIRKLGKPITILIDGLTLPKRDRVFSVPSAKHALVVAAHYPPSGLSFSIHQSADLIVAAPLVPST